MGQKKQHEDLDPDDIPTVVARAPELLEKEAAPTEALTPEQLAEKLAKRAAEEEDED